MEKVDFNVEPNGKRLTVLNQYYLFTTYLCLSLYVCFVSVSLANGKEYCCMVLSLVVPVSVLKSVFVFVFVSVFVSVFVFADTDG